PDRIFGIPLLAEEPFAAPEPDPRAPTIQVQPDLELVAASADRSVARPDAVHKITCWPAPRFLRLVITGQIVEPHADFPPPLWQPGEAGGSERQFGAERGHEVGAGVEGPVELQQRLPVSDPVDLRVERQGTGMKLASVAQVETSRLGAGKCLGP